jgi:hypothetical protein
MPRALRVPPSDAGVAGADLGEETARLRSEPMLRIHGYGDPQRVRPDISEAAARMAKHVEAVMEPRAWHRVLAVEGLAGDVLTLEDGTVLRAGDFPGVLADCEAVVPFVLTIGPRFDEEARSLSADGNLLEALFLQTAGWLALEHATKAFATRLRSWAGARGYRLTRRLAPGYGSWPLTGQVALFSVFGASSPGVSLLESCAMVPGMSRSGMYGLRPGECGR